MELRSPIAMLTYLVLAGVAGGQAHHVRPSCGPDVRTCKFVFSIKYNVTMMKWQGRDPVNPDSMIPIVLDDGKLYSKRKDCSGRDLLSQHDFETMMSGDGSYKRAIVANGKLPGPPIVVYKDQHVSVTVINEMENEVITVHWHGLHMRGTPWMDGAGTVSHCPIQPRQRFEYRFVADPVGTHWWHGHFSSERTMGLFGPLIVLDRSPEDENIQRGGDPLPPFEHDFIMMVNDWYPEATDEMFNRLHYGGMMLANSPHMNQCLLPTNMADGTIASTFYFHSALINGKGWHFNSTTGEADNTALPLEVFVAKRYRRHRFRLINAGMEYSLKISIDNHMLNVFASDGQPIQTVKVDSVVISSGERFDFFIEATDPLDIGNYWIRVETLEYYSPFGKRIEPGHVEAILRYEEAKETAPTTVKPICSHTKPCVILNCPFRDSPPGSWETCTSVDNLRRPASSPTLQPSHGTGFTEYFLNFQMGPDKASINGKSYVGYVSPPQLYPTKQRSIRCDREECEQGDCECTHELEVPLGHVIQMVFVSVTPVVGPPAVTFHPIHTHGHKFQVLKTGWPVYDPQTGKMMTNSPDIDYSVSPLTGADLRWANRSWSGGRVPGLVRRDPIEKDTVQVPAGGYVVVRFLADNPGYWLLHCHTESHSSTGMVLLMKEGEETAMSPAPVGIPTCGDFDWSSEEYRDKITNPRPPTLRTQAVKRNASTTKAYQIAAIVVGCVMSVLLLLTVVVFRRTSTCRKAAATTAESEPSYVNPRIRRGSYGCFGRQTVKQSQTGSDLTQETTPLISSSSLLSEQ